MWKPFCSCKMEANFNSPCSFSVFLRSSFVYCRTFISPDHYELSNVCNFASTFLRNLMWIISFSTIHSCVKMNFEIVLKTAHDNAEGFQNLHFHHHVWAYYVATLPYLPSFPGFFLTLIFITLLALIQNEHTSLKSMSPVRIVAVKVRDT